MQTEPAEALEIERISDEIAIYVVGDHVVIKTGNRWRAPRSVDFVASVAHLNILEDIEVITLTAYRIALLCILGRARRVDGTDNFETLNKEHEPTGQIIKIL